MGGPAEGIKEGERERGDVRDDGLLSGAETIVLIGGAGVELGRLGYEARLDDVLRVALVVCGHGACGEEGDGEEELHRVDKTVYSRLRCKCSGCYCLVGDGGLLKRGTGERVVGYYLGIREMERGRERRGGTRWRGVRGGFINGRIGGSNDIHHAQSLGLTSTPRAVVLCSSPCPTQTDPRGIPPLLGDAIPRDTTGC